MNSLFSWKKNCGTNLLQKHGKTMSSCYLWVEYEQNHKYNAVMQHWKKQVFTAKMN